MNIKYLKDRGIIITLSINIYLALLFAKVTGLINGTEKIRLILIFYMVIVACLGSIEVICKKSKINKLLIIMYLYLFIVLFMIIIYGKLNITNLLNYIFFPLSFIATYTSYRKIKYKKIFEKILQINILFFFIFAFIFLKTQILSGITSREWVNTIYYIVIMIPFLFLIKSKHRKNICIGLALFTVFLSLKRAAFLSSILAVLIYKYLILKDKNNSKRNILKLIKIIVSVLMLTIILNTITTNLFNYDIIARVLEIGKDGGSGRSMLLKDMIERIESSSLKEMIAGHEMLPSSYENNYNISVHNDYLEVFWRGGIILFISYISIFVNLFKNLRIIKWKNKEIYASFTASICIFVVISGLSQLIYVPSYSSLLCMLWSYCLCYINLK